MNIFPDQVRFNDKLSAPGVHRFNWVGTKRKK